MKASLIVMAASAALEATAVHTWGCRRSNASCPPVLRAAAGGAVAAGGLVTKSRSTASPITPMAKLATKIRSKRCGAAARTTKAASGPSIAPAASMARCTPNDCPRSSRALLSEINASRGAVRTPLPMRSAVTVAAIQAGFAPTTSHAILLTADTA